MLIASANFPAQLWQSLGDICIFSSAYCRHHSLSVIWAKCWFALQAKLSAAVSELDVGSEQRRAQSGLIIK